MAIDFEQEANITETVARPPRARGGRIGPLLLGSAALAILGYAAYVSFGSRGAPASTETQEEFKTASRSGHLNSIPRQFPNRRTTGSLSHRRSSRRSKRSNLS